MTAKTLLVVVPKADDGRPICARRSCRVSVDAEAQWVLDMGGEVVCQECMAELLELHGDEIEGPGC